jgi:hypothetical protein
MTIGEHLQRQVRTCNRIKWAGIAVLVIVTFQQVDLRHCSVAMYSWMAAVILPLLGALGAFAKRVRCPRRRKYLFRELASHSLTAFTVLRDAKREWSGNTPLAFDACP